MGRAVEVDKRLDSLEIKVNEILLILDELAQVSTTKENIDLNEATKEKANSKGNRASNIKADSGKSKKSTSNNKNSASSK